MGISDKRRRGIILGLLLHALFLLSLGGVAQETADSLWLRELQEVVVTATLLPTAGQQLPYAEARIGPASFQRGQQLSLGEPLQQLPGLLALSPYNFAQDLRLSVRGFGARSAFGIRGIAVWVDGLPESTPDGQAQVDNLDAGLLSQASLLRSPASGWYGNAAGGVLNLQTVAPPEEAGGRARLSAGSFGFQKYQLQVGGPGWVAYGAHTRFEGYREQSRAVSSLFNAKKQWSWEDGQNLELLFNLAYSPVAQDPGGLPEEGLEAPGQAWGSNLAFDAGETVLQGKAGLKWQQRLGPKAALSAFGFYLFRDFSNRLPFETGGIVKLFRHYAGVGLKLSGKYSPALRGTTGITVLGLSDGRQRYDNLEGEQGALALDQQEEWMNVGVYHVQEWRPSAPWRLQASLRYDLNALGVKDRWLEDGDDSGGQVFHNLSPALGLFWQGWENIGLYANYAYSFEAPALSELSANPTGGGFNPALRPQQAHSTELGLKSSLGSMWEFDLCGYQIFLRSELVPYELEGQPGRTYYSNAGASSRRGVEARLALKPSGPLSGQVAYNYADFEYTDFETGGTQLSGNALPGIPRHWWAGQLAWAFSQGAYLKAEARQLGALFADDANATRVEGFLELGLHGGYTFSAGPITLQLMGGANNILGQAYAQNIRINAFGGRHFEPAPGRNIYFAVEVGW